MDYLDISIRLLIDTKSYKTKFGNWFSKHCQRWTFDFPARLDGKFQKNLKNIFRVSFSIWIVDTYLYGFKRKWQSWILYNVVNMQGGSTNKWHVQKSDGHLPTIFTIHCIINVIQKSIPYLYRYCMYFYNSKEHSCLYKINVLNGEVIIWWLKEYWGATT